MNFDDWWKDYVGGDKDRSLETGRIYAESAWDHQQQRIEALEIGIINVKTQVQDAKIYGTDWIWKALAALLPGDD